MDIKSLLKTFDLEDTFNSLASHYNISGEQLSLISSSMFPVITNALLNSLSDPMLMEKLIKAGSQIDLAAIKENSNNLLSSENSNLGFIILKTLLGGENRLAETVANLTKRTGLPYETLSGLLPTLTALVVAAFLKNGGELRSLVSSIFTSGNAGGNSDSSLHGILGKARELLVSDGDGSLLKQLIK